MEIKKKLQNEEKPLKFVLGLPKWEFSTEKTISHREKYQEK